MRPGDAGLPGLGIGVSAYVEVTAPVGLHVEWGSCEVHEDGTATVYTGTSPHGQGHETAWAMLASDETGIPMDKITLVWGDTDLVPEGGGTMGSRSLQHGGVRDAQESPVRHQAAELDQSGFVEQRPVDVHAGRDQALGTELDWTLRESTRDAERGLPTAPPPMGSR